MKVSDGLGIKSDSQVRKTHVQALVLDNVQVTLVAVRVVQNCCLGVHVQHRLRLEAEFLTTILVRQTLVYYQRNIAAIPLADS